MINCVMMKEIFDICRFKALAWKYYRENMKTILIFLGVMVVVTFMVVCKFNPFRMEYTSLYTGSNYLDRYYGMFAKIFWGLLGFFLLFAASYSFADFMSGKKSFGALLLPASSFEKLLLAILNSTVVVFLLHVAVFYSVAHVACSYKYTGFKEADKIAVAESWSGFSYPVLTSGAEIVHPKVGNVFSVVDRFSESSAYTREVEDGTGVRKERTVYFTPFVVWNLLIMYWLYFVFVFMWGSITFRKRSALLTILVHGLFFLFLGWLVYRVGTVFWKIPREEAMLYGLYFYNTGELVPLSASWLLLLYIVPLTYVGIIWKKLKNKQV
ncbi:hypothetical protein D1136_02050 [Odoribacter sp. Z80]|nr:hypothetical protein [Odoribacter sp. Z80]